jgi:hypothetical protein
MRAHTDQFYDLFLWLPIASISSLSDVVVHKLIKCYILMSNKLRTTLNEHSYRQNMIRNPQWPDFIDLLNYNYDSVRTINHNILI